MPATTYKILQAVESSGCQTCSWNIFQVAALAVLAVELRGPLKELGLKVLVERQAPQHLNQRLEELLVDGLSVSFGATTPDIADTLADFWISGMSGYGSKSWTGP